MAKDDDTKMVLWTHEQLASFLQITGRTLETLVHAGTVPPPYYVGAHRRYDPAEVMHRLRSTRRPPRSAQRPEPLPGGSTPVL